MAVDDSTIRDWARRNGYQVGERGRLQENVKEAFYREFPNTRPAPENPNGTCKECWQMKTAHRDWCSFYVAPVTATEYVPDFPAEVTPEPAQTVEEATNDPGAALAALVAQIAAGTVSAAPAIDVGQVETIARRVTVEEVESRVLEAVAALTQPKIVNITIGDRPTFTFGADKIVHKEFENVLRLVKRGLNVYLYGPPGTGKSTIVEQVAEALGIPYAALPCGPTTPESRVFGFIDANGIYRGPEFRKVTEFGGIFCFEEIDNGHPGIVTTMNVALANGHCPFPDGDVKKHTDTYYIATANTHGTGATRQHIGRNALDAATLDRFVEWEIGIDEAIEEKATLAQCTRPETLEAIQGWLSSVREWRKNAAGKPEVIISPRAAINGAAMIDEGFSFEQARQATVIRGMSADLRRVVIGDAV